ncbi:TrmO family methyltransferase domain-containing protein [Vibrio alginolyticus]|uniref:TrmO family methyltransferase domain-containing protein n=1 Tax=Vibrio alginolyticus TaxID=663 RepID=UPI002FF09EE8
MQKLIDTNLTFIGKIHTPYESVDDCPCNIQQEGPLCKLSVEPQYQGELRGLKAGSAILILYWLGKPIDGVGYVALTDENEPGTFAMRTPFRPNPIGVAVVAIEKMEDNLVYVKGLDCLNGTELLDIKPAILHEYDASIQRNASLEGCDCDKPEVSCR